jgi:hypothetical protein
MDKKMQVFIKIEDFKDITEIMTLARQRLQQAKNILNRIAELKAQEDAEFEAWTGEIAEIERRMQAVDSSLLGRNEENA